MMRGTTEENEMNKWTVIVMTIASLWAMISVSIYITAAMINPEWFQHGCG